MNQLSFFLVIVCFIGIFPCFQSFLPLSARNSNKFLWEIKNIETKSNLNPSLNSLHPKSNSKDSKLQAIKGPVRYSSNDWIDCLLSLPTSRILKRTRKYILVNILWTALLVWLYKFKTLTYVFPSAVHSILGSALALLLVFRTNSSYDRFWEGRKLWGSIINSCREISRLSATYMKKRYHESIANLLVTFCIVSKQHLQGERVNAELEPYFSNSKELTDIQKLFNRPSYVLLLLHKVIHEGLQDGKNKEDTSSAVVTALHEHSFIELINSLSHSITSCERILKQPVPLSYSRHTSRFLSLYLFTLPLTLIPYLSWWTIPTIAAICWSFTSIQEIGQFIEEPFNKELEIISIAQMISVVRSDISGLFHIFLY